MAVNKVEVNGETVLDLTNDTVSEDSLLDGTTAHNGAGNPIEGKVKLSSVSIADNENGGIDISVDGNKKTLASQESVSQLKDGLSAAVAQHNTDAAAHNDLRIALQGLSDRINAALDSDDTTLDQMSEVVAYIKSNKTLIDAITTSKVSVADIVNDLVTNVANKPLSAAQGVALKGLIEELRTLIPEVYTLPVATETVLGGVKPVTATEAMTQPVGVTDEGRLVTKPGEGGSGIAVTGATVGQTVKIAAVDDAGMPTAWEPVDLPIGVGSCKHIETITIPDGDEIAVITFTIPAKTRKLYVIGRTNTSSTFGTAVRPYVKNGNTVLAVLNSNQSMEHRKALFAAELHDNIQFMAFSSSNFGFTAAYPGNESFYDYASYFYAENNTFNIIIQSASSNKYFAPGCTFELYALCEE